MDSMDSNWLGGIVLAGPDAQARERDAADPLVYPG